MSDRNQPAMAEVFFRVAVASFGGYWAGGMCYGVFASLFPYWMTAFTPFGTAETVALVASAIAAGAALSTGASEQTRRVGLFLYALVVVFYNGYWLNQGALTPLMAVLWSLIDMGTARYVCRKWPLVTGVPQEAAARPR